MLTPSDVVKATMSEDARNALTHIQSALQDMVDSGDVDYSELISIYLPVSLDSASSYAVQKNMVEAGWCNVTIRGKSISFYFPS